MLAESLIIMTGKFDLSLESIYGFAPAIGAMTVVPAAEFRLRLRVAGSVGILVVLLVGGLIGFINGFMVVRLRLSAFIVTLAMLIILRGMLVGATKGGRCSIFLPPSYGLMVIIFLGLPLAVWLAAFAFAIAGLVLRYHRLGRALYAIGGNPEAARAAGIRVERITWGVYVLAGMLAALGRPRDHRLCRRDQRQPGQRPHLHRLRRGGDRRHFARRRQGHHVRRADRRAAARRRGNLLTLAQVPSFWIQAIYGAIILGSLMVARFASGQSQE